MKDLVYRDPCDGESCFAKWLNDLRNQSGAYVIRSKRTHEILYVGNSHTGRLAKTIKRHFHTWDDIPDRVHHVYSRHSVEIAVGITPPNSAAGAEENLILRLEPRDNGTNPKAENPF